MLNWKIDRLSMRRLDFIWPIMVNMPSEKLYNKRACSEGRGQLICGKAVKYFPVSAAESYIKPIHLLQKKIIRAIVFEYFTFCSNFS